MSKHPRPRLAATAAALLILGLRLPAAADVALDCLTAPHGGPQATISLTAPDLPTFAGSCRSGVRGRFSVATAFGWDVYVMLDSSGSTAGTSGIDLDGDGVVGTGDWRTNTDPGDSTLMAELEAVRRALDAWEGLDVRVAVGEFSAVIPIPPGEPSEQGRIRTVQGLTADFDAVRAALDVIAAAGSVGATDYGGGLGELAAEFDRSGDASRRPIAFFLSDGKPTFPRFPYDTTELLDVDRARDGAHEVALRGLPTNTLEIGVFDDVGVLSEVASITGGVFVPALLREDILDGLLRVPLGGFTQATVSHDGSGQVAEAELRDGGFTADVTLDEGYNHLTLVASLRTPEGAWDYVCPFEVTADCLGGCTLTVGWWKTHHRHAAPGPLLVPWPLDEDAVLCGQTWLEILLSPPRGDGWVVLAHQWIAAKLNQAFGAECPGDLDAAIDEAEALLAGCAISRADRVRATELAALLDALDNGEIGPGHCEDGETPVGTPGGGDPSLRDTPRSRFSPSHPGLHLGVPSGGATRGRGGGTAH